MPAPTERPTAEAKRPTAEAERPVFTALMRGSQEERQEQKDKWLQPGKFDVCVTTFEMCSREKGSLRKFKWQYAPNYCYP